MLYVGVDVHKAKSQVTVMDEVGKVIQRKRIESSQAGVSAVLGAYCEPLKAVRSDNAEYKALSKALKDPEVLRKISTAVFRELRGHGGPP